MNGMVELDYYLKSLKKDEPLQKDTAIQDLAKAMEQISNLMAQLQEKQSETEIVEEKDEKEEIEEQEL